MFCALCAKGEKKRADYKVCAYENLQRQDELYCCEEHTPILALRLLKVVDTVAIRNIGEERE